MKNRKVSKNIRQQTRESVSSTVNIDKSSASRSQANFRFLVFGQILAADALPLVAISHKLPSDSIGDYQNYHQLASYRVITAIVLSVKAGKC